MSWETKTVMEQRKQFVLAALAEDANISELCREYGISRKTGHKWINRSELGLPLCDHMRPHHTLGLKTPASVYIPSTRPYYEPKPCIYEEGAKLIKVNNWGILRFGPIRIFLSESMADTKVEIRFAENDTFSVIYRNYIIASVDAVERKLLNRHIQRL